MEQTAHLDAACLEYIFANKVLWKDVHTAKIEVLWSERSDVRKSNGACARN